MRSLAWTVVVAVAALAAAAPERVVAQQGAVPDGGRDCQTVRVCNFRKGGSYRGCISAYTCRTCQLVRASCRVGDRRRNCHELRCGWGA